MAIGIRSEQKPTDTWDLSALYSGISDWKSDYSALEQNLSLVRQYRGTLTKSAGQLKAAVAYYLETFRQLEKLYTYAHLRHDQDLGNAENMGYFDQVTGLYTRLATEWSFFTPELLAAEGHTLTALFADPVLRQYKRMLEETVRYKPHTLYAGEEQLLALSADALSSSRRIFEQLNNVDLDFGSINVDGDEQPLSHETLMLFLRNKDRNVRKKASEQYYGEFEQHQNTLAAALSSSVKKDVFLSRAKNYSSCLAMGIFGENVSPKVYETLVASVRANITPHHRYYKLRKKLLGLSDMRMYDSYVPLAATDTRGLPYDDAVSEICESLAPLGDDYVSTLRAGLTTGRWVDRYENKGKRSGAYSSGCFDSPPYILMNYKAEEIDSAFTLTHEAGHSMHSFLSRKHQPYQDHSYTIFVAEVASTFNEILLIDHLKKKYAADKNMLSFLINHQIDALKGTFFTQTMFAEFEKKIHDIAEQNQPITVEVFRNAYRSLIEVYYGDAVTLSDLDDLSGLRIPHFYSAFYVYKYATGIAAAISLATRVLSGDTAARDRYLNFLQSGGSKHPLDLLRDAGVDMESPEPVATTIELFDSLITEFEQVATK